MKIVELNQIKKILASVDIVPKIEEGLVAYSKGDVIMPPVGELIFKDPPGDVHIKSGYMVRDDYYVIKIASGFYDNPKLHLPSSNGLMMLFGQKTGAILAILLDEGHLTDLRTAAAGAISAKYLAPRVINKIGIIGTGTQAKLQLQFLRQIIQCKDVIVWGRDPNKLLHFQTEMQAYGFKISSTQSIDEITSDCNLIVTTTPSSTPILFAHQIRKGTHITAVGADSPHKQEIDENIFALADIVVADSITQCIERGDIAHAIRKNIISPNKLIELGNIITGTSSGRAREDQITIADLTGLAVEDLQIAKAVYENV